MTNLSKVTVVLVIWIRAHTQNTIGCSICIIAETARRQNWSIHVCGFCIGSTATVEVFAETFKVVVVRLIVRTALAVTGVNDNIIFFKVNVVPDISIAECHVILIAVKQWITFHHHVIKPTPCASILQDSEHHAVKINFITLWASLANTADVANTGITFWLDFINRNVKLEVAAVLTTSVGYDEHIFKWLIFHHSGIAEYILIDTNHWHFLPVTGHVPPNQTVFNVHRVRFKRDHC